METAEMAFQHINNHCLFETTDDAYTGQDFREMTKSEFINVIRGFAKHDNMPLVETALCSGHFYEEVRKEIL